MSQDRMQRLVELPRLRKEAETIRAMVRLYCKAHHAPAPQNPNGVCAKCQAFLDYALKRLACCPFGEEKPVCAKCRIHCYKPAERETAREIMRWAGPRLLWHHPIMAVRHVFDNMRPAPEKPRNRAKPAAVAAKTAPCSSTCADKAVESETPKSSNPTE